MFQEIVVDDIQSSKKKFFTFKLKFRMLKKKDKSKKLQQLAEESVNSSFCSSTSSTDLNDNLKGDSETIITTEFITEETTTTTELIKEEKTTTVTTIITSSSPSSSSSSSSSSQPVASTSLSIKDKTIDPSTTLDNGNNLSNNNEEIIEFDEISVLPIKDSTKKKNKLFGFLKNRKWNFNIKKKNYSNSSVNSINSEDNEQQSEQNDSAYETESDNNFCYENKKKKRKSTKLIPLSTKDREYNEIKKSFHEGLPGKKILGIIRLQMPTKLVEAHEKYKKEVAEQNGKLESQICHRMFHGTKSAYICSPQRFSNKKHFQPHCKIGCGVCGIIQEGNKMKYSQYGERMWFASESSTSLSYCGDSTVKSMFVVDVVNPVHNTILIIESDEATIPKYLIVFQM